MGGPLIFNVAGKVHEPNIPLALDQEGNPEDGITKFVAESCAAYNMELDKAFDQIKIHFIGH